MISAILNVGQKVDQDWALHIQDNQGSHHRVCKVAIIKFSSTWMVAWLMENNFQLFSGDLGPWGDGLVWVRQTQPRQVGCFYGENRKSILFLVLAFPPFLEKSRLWRSFQSSCQDETFHDEKLHSNWAKKIVEDDKVIPKHFRMGHLNFILINMFLIRMGDLNFFLLKGWITSRASTLTTYSSTIVQKAVGTQVIIN